jgi:hypothetical protein
MNPKSAQLSMVLILLNFLLIAVADVLPARSQETSAGVGSAPQAASTENVYVDRSPGYTITAYYWPDYHVDPWNEKWFGPGWTEWELIKWARPRFAAHDQPKVPLWGYEDESDPRVMARKIDTAAKYGVDVLLFDWQYYNNGTFLRAALDKGFLGAPNNRKVKFALMWANHDMPDVFPAKSYQSYPDISILIPGEVTRETFDKMVDEIIAKYFKHPSYWLVDGCPHFSIYDLNTLVKGLGGLEKTRQALADFRAKTKAAGFPDLHLDVMLRFDHILTEGSTLVLANDVGASSAEEQNRVASELGIKSLSSYTWLHGVTLANWPTTPYVSVRERAMEYWHTATKTFSVPYYPNVTCGWDSTSRIVSSDIYMNKGYPHMPVIVGNTPVEFKTSLQEVKKFLDASGSKQKIFSINSWNEWTEGSYLEPDKTNGFGFLEAIKEVFGGKN